MSQPPYPQQPPYAQGQLVLIPRKPPGWLSASMMTPQLRIDGQPAPARWEPTVYPIVAGRHRIEASTTYMWEYGRAGQDVEIAPGQTLELHYSPPMVTVLGGRMGFELQPRPGQVALWVILGGVFLVVLLVVIGIIASSAGG
jgi:hypothetical protein